MQEELENGFKILNLENLMVVGVYFKELWEIFAFNSEVVSNSQITFN